MNYHHIINREDACNYSAIFSYCPECDTCPTNATYEKVSAVNYKCPNCGYIGPRDSFINKLITDPKDI